MTSTPSSWPSQGSLARRPTPGTVLGVLALIVAVSGVSIASIPSKTGVVTACYSKRTGAVRLIDKDKKQKCKRREKATSWNQKGQKGDLGGQGPAGVAGSTGVAGTNGDNGIPGGPGQPGSSGPGLLFGTGIVTQNQTTFTSLAGSNTTTQADAFTPIPAGAQLTARDFSVRLSSNVAAGQSVTFALQVNGADKLACTISGGASSCASSDTVVLSPGDNVNYRNTASVTAGNHNATYVARIVF